MASANNEVKDLLLEVGESLGRSAQQMEAFVKILVDENWFDTLDSLKGLSDERWRSFGLPMKLEVELRRRIGDSRESQSASAEERHPHESDVLMSAAAGGGNHVADASGIKDAPSSSSSSSSSSSVAFPEGPLDFGGNDGGVGGVSEAVNALMSATADSPDVLKSSITTLMKIIVNLLSDPDNQKYKSVRLENPTIRAKIVDVPGALQVLQSVGFVESVPGTMSVAITYLSRLTDLYALLSESMRALDLEPPVLQGRFNPFVSSISSTQPTNYSRVHGKAAEQRFAEADEVNREIKRRQHLLEAGGEDSSSAKVAMDPHIFHISHLGRIEQAMRDTGRLSQSPNSSSSSSSSSSSGPVVADDDDDGIPEDAINIEALKQSLTSGPQFHSRAKQQLKQLKKQKVFDTSVIRVLFPDKIILQMTFHVTTKFKDVCIALTEFLDASVVDRKWYLYETPPPRQFAMTQTLAQAGLVPGAMLHFALKAAPDVETVQMLPESTGRVGGLLLSGHNHQGGPFLAPGWLTALSTPDQLAPAPSSPVGGGMSAGETSAMKSAALARKYKHAEK